MWYFVCVFIGFSLGWLFCALWIGGKSYAERYEIDYTIPKPKFQLGDIVYDVWTGKSFKIQNCSYSIVMKKWYYYDGQKRFNKGDHVENNLKGMKDGITE